MALQKRNALYEKLFFSYFLICAFVPLWLKKNTMIEFSFWEKETFLKGFDAIVIGSGIVGLNAAINLKKMNPKLRILIVERGILPYGASTRNAGFACFGSVSELLDDLETHPEEKVWALVEKRWKGLARLRNLVGEANMEYEFLGGFEIFTEEEAHLYEKCEAIIPDFNQKLSHIVGKKVTYNILNPKEVANFGFGKVKQIIHNQEEGQLHTGKMMHTLLAVAKELKIEFLTGINILSLEENTTSASLYCEGGIVLSAPKILVCTNGFAKNLLPDLAVNPARNQVWVTEEIEDLVIKGAFHYQQGYYYFRNVGNRILIGGGRHLDKENESTMDFGSSEIIQNALEKVLSEIILPKKKVKIEHKWSGILGVGNEKSSIIQQYSEHIFVAVRMGGMGVAIGSLVGEELAELVIKN